MNCMCGADTKVTNTRKHESGGIWRSRKCLVCAESFSTLEQHYVKSTKAPVCKPVVVQVKRGKPTTLTPSLAAPPVTQEAAAPVLLARHRIEELKSRRAMRDIYDDED